MQPDDGNDARIARVPDNSSSGSNGDDSPRENDYGNRDNSSNNREHGDNKRGNNNSNLGTDHGDARVDRVPEQDADSQNGNSLDHAARDEVDQATPDSYNDDSGGKLNDKSDSGSGESSDKSDGSGYGLREDHDHKQGATHDYTDGNMNNHYGSPVNDKSEDDDQDKDSNSDSNDQNDDDQNDQNKDQNKSSDKDNKDSAGLKLNNDNPLEKAKDKLGGGADGISKTLSGQGENNPIQNAANNLKKGLGKKIAKEAVVQTPKMAGLYAGGKLFDKMMQMVGLAINGAGAAVQGAIVNSPVGGFLNWAHGVVQNISNFIKGVGSTIAHNAHVGMQMLGHMGSTIGNLAHGAAAGIAHGASNAMNSVISFFTGQTVQAATVSTTTVTHGMVAISTIAALSGIGYGLTSYSNSIRDSPQPIACQELVDNAETGGSVNASQKEDDYAKMAYSVFKTYGMTDDAIAGILGNWSIESGIDPTIIEGFSGIEMYHIGPRKKQVLSHLDAYAKKCAAAAGGNYSGYGSCPGLGLGQWTSGRGLRLLAAAKKNNKKWYDMGFQLAYVLAEPQQYHARLNMRTYAKKKGVAACTQDWLLNWEGIDNGTLDKRTQAAEGWRKKMSGWRVDQKQANNILAMAKHMGTKATATAVNDAADNCAKAEQGADNSSLVKAALSYAWDSDDLAKGNDGTKLYQKVHRGIFPGDPHFQSCDRVVACAVRWSGTDIGYPAGSTAQQYQHDMSDKHWKKVGTTSSMHYSELKPGDIFLCNGVHTFLFVGNRAVKDSIASGMHKKSTTPANGDEVDGSLNQRSAGIGVDGRYSIEHGDGNTYTIFRNVKDDNSGKYKNVASLAK